MKILHGQGISTTRVNRKSKAQSPEDDKFDTIIGELEDLLVGNSSHKKV